MPKFRKKPVVIEAWRFDGSLSSIESLLDLSGALTVAGGSSDLHAEITTLEGVMTASVGDWIIRGDKGELYPCKPDIFAATYDRAD